MQADPASDIDAARGAFSKGRWAESDSLATAALAQLEREERPDSVAIAGALSQIAWSRFKLVGHGDGTALRAAARALDVFEHRLGPDHLDVADTHYLVGILLRGMTQLDSATVHLRRAVDIRTRTGDSDALAEAWYSLGLIERDRPNYRAARENLQRSIEILRRVHGGEDSSMVSALVQSGRCLHFLGDMDGARQETGRALSIIRACGSDHPDHWMALDNLAVVERSAGNLALAFDLQKEAVRLAELSNGADSRSAYAMRGNLGNLLSDFGDYAGAKSTLEPLVPLREAQYGRTHPRALHTRLHYAIARGVLGDTAAALSDFEYVESSLSARPGPPDPNLSLALRWHALFLHRQGRHLEARSLCERSIRVELSRPFPRPERLARNQFLLIAVLEALGDSAALDSARHELSRIDETYTLDSSENGPPIPYYMARAARSLGRRPEALAEALEAERLSRERLHLNLRALSDRRALEFVRQQSGYLELVLDLSRGDAGGSETAWDRLIRSRGLVRAELARRRPPEGFESDSLIVGTHGRWIETQRRLAQALVSLPESGRDSLGQAALEGLRGESDNAEGAYARALASRGASAAPSDVGWLDVRSHIKPGQALVSLVGVGQFLPALSPGSENDSLMAFVTNGGSNVIERVDLGSSAGLHLAVEAWRQEIAKSPGPGTRPGGRAERECRRQGLLVRAATWDRIAPYVAGATEVFIVGEGPLIDFPWGALPDGPDGYLVEAGPCLHLLNAERELVERTQAADTGSLLAMGAPDYDYGAVGKPGGAEPVTPSLRSSLDPCASGDLPAFAPLPGSGAEALAVATTWRAGPGHRATVLTGPDASEKAFKDNARGQLVIHLATHGVVAGDTCSSGRPGQRGVGGVGRLNPSGRQQPSPAQVSQASPAAVPSPWLVRRVWLALAGANRARDHRIDENEGLLTAEEVLTLDLAGTDWVVLSACHSGLAETWSREGMLGMRRALDLAGARTVIASQWAVEDDSTREWMQALYAARAAGAPTAGQAMKAASCAILSARREAGRSTHPFYWAAFTASGE